MSYNFPKLTDIELRVLGSLIEKSRSTPEYYPMTLNAITLACNQKTSRKPVTDYSESEVSAALSNLKGISLVSTAIGGSIRSAALRARWLLRVILMTCTSRGSPTAVFLLMKTRKCMCAGTW